MSLTPHSEPTRGVVRRLSVSVHDDELVERLKARSPSAWAELFDRSAPKVRRTLFRTIGFDTEANDLLQEVFLAAYRGIEGYRGNAGGLDAWLSAIAVAKARGCLRRRKARRWLHFFAPEKMPEGEPQEFPEEAYSMLRRIHQALERFPVEERLVFALRLFGQMELMEIAEVLGISDRTVKRRLARSRARFERMARQDPELVTWLTTSDSVKTTGLEPEDSEEQRESVP